MESAVPCDEPSAGSNRLEALLADEAPAPEELQATRTRIAGSAAFLPITAEMAWAVPQLLKRIALVAPGILSTSGVLRALVRTPEWDEPFAKAFVESGFLSCDKALERARWKYDVGEMLAKQHGDSAWEVLEHCRSLLAQHGEKQPLDWAATLGELQTLACWFPDLRTVRLLQQLYTRLYVLDVKSMHVVQCWLDWRAGLADPAPDYSEGAGHA
jgi:hypothetical protein